MRDFRLFDNQRRRAERPKGSATAASIALHALLLAYLAYALQVPAALTRILSASQPEQTAPERLRFVTVAQPAPTSAVPTTREQPPPAARTEVEAAPPLAAPREVPTTLPPPAVDTAARPTTPAFTGPIAGGAGPTRGALPTYSDPRIWVADPALVYAPKTDLERLDSALVTTLGRYLDSLAANTYQPNKFERGDWTVERNGQKWGIDQSAIRLGKFSIPSALLALLPLNGIMGNPIAAERDRAMSSMRADILYHARASMNEEEFRRAVRAIRDRKERERRALERNPRSPGPIVSPGDRPPEGDRK
ncbi:MAG TPA: hypothetical protein VLE53_05390 [Gemmatimonadaceae bacterium]|nr:hypothetical protein [Gemmatimonadaceae bacterium]